ncbi:MAG TPA: DUF445 family protein [Bacilli bacterium]|nr:DUF445 family protein [Bacilli bacterium]
MLEMLISIGVGALIGLFTNWLAIVMLFRPWKEKRLLGMRLPLTPGLIPRRHEELAEKLGEIVEEELLTPEGVGQAIKKPELEFAVKRSAIRSIGETLNEAPTAGELAERLFGEDAMSRGERWLTARAVDFLRSEAGREKLSGMADSLFDHLRGSLSSAEIRSELAKGFSKPLYLQLAQGDLTWEQAFPDALRGLIEERLQDQLEPLLRGAADWVVEPAVVQAISKMLTEKVENIPLIGGMAKGFLTPERVGSDIAPRLQNVILSHTTRDLVEGKLREGLAAFWSRPISRYIGRLSPDDLHELVDKLLHHLFDRLFREEGDARDTFRRLAVDGLLAGANEKTVGDLLSRLVDGLYAWNLRDLYVANTDTLDRLLTKAWRHLRGELVDGIPDIMEALGVRHIVREQVVSFPIPTLEKLILGVVNRELRWITVLGGVLGAVIGFVQALLLL